MRQAKNAPVAVSSEVAVAPPPSLRQRIPAKGKLPIEPVAAAASAVAEGAGAGFAKPKRPKLVRDSFTIPKAEYVTLQDLKQRAIKLGHHAKKSELLRAGIKTLAAMTDEAFLASMANVPAVKTGRPAKG